MRGTCLTGVDVYYTIISCDDETYKTKLPLKKLRKS